MKRRVLITSFVALGFAAAACGHALADDVVAFHLSDVVDVGEAPAISIDDLTGGVGGQSSSADPSGVIIQFVQQPAASGAAAGASPRFAATPAKSR